MLIKLFLNHFNQQKMIIGLYYNFISMKNYFFNKGLNNFLWMHKF
jgi:hypothetical protein